MFLSYVFDHSVEVAGYLFLLFSSYKAITYVQRLYFHPLSEFPGPKICAASRVQEFYYDSWLNGRWWRRLPELHAHYGPIVRIGPDELHIQDKDYFQHLFGFRPLDKYAMTARQFGMGVAMFGTEGYKQYTQRRAAYADAFSRSKTMQLQPLANAKIRKACDWIDARVKSDGSIDFAYLYRALTAEIITEYMYGRQYGFFDDEKLTKGLYDRRYDQLFGMTHLGRFIPFWIPIILVLIRTQISGLLSIQEPTASFLSFRSFAGKMLRSVVDEHGVQQAPDPNKEYKTAASIYLHSSLPIADKSGDALIEATMAPWSGGWDTTAFALTLSTYYVLKHPNVKQRLVEELNSALPGSDAAMNYTILNELEYLAAVVKESLRLMHGALSRLHRVNPNAPEKYGKWTIPAGTKVSMSLPDINLDTSIWGSDAEEFRPERWLGHPELDEWLATFSRGTRVCAGEELAWMEMKMIIATLFRRYEMEIKADANVTDDDIVSYSDGFTPGPKNLMQRLPVVARRFQ